MSESAERSSSVAFFLGLLVPGLGHWYVGNVRVAIAFVIATAAALPISVFACAGLGVYAGIWGVVAGAWVVHLASALHAAWTVRSGSARSDVPGQSTAGYVGFAVVCIGLSLLGRFAMETYAFESYSMPADSMRPTLQMGDDFTVAKLRARDREARRGDLVVFPYPEDPSATFVKRVVGLPGETLTFHGRQQPPTIDGVPMTWAPCESSSAEHLCMLETTPEGAQYELYLMQLRGDPAALAPPAAPLRLEVPSGHVFVLGDNRNQSHDSLVFGPIPISSIEGRAVTRFLPWDRRGSLLSSERD